MTEMDKILQEYRDAKIELAIAPEQLGAFASACYIMAVKSTAEAAQLNAQELLEALEKIDKEFNNG